MNYLLMPFESQYHFRITKTTIKIILNIKFLFYSLTWTNHTPTLHHTKSHGKPARNIQYVQRCVQYKQVMWSDAGSLCPECRRARPANPPSIIQIDARNSNLEFLFFSARTVVGGQCFCFEKWGCVFCEVLFNSFWRLDWFFWSCNNVSLFTFFLIIK